MESAAQLVGVVLRPPKQNNHSCKHPEKMFHRDTCAPVFGYQTTDAMNYKKLEFPSDFHSRTMKSLASVSKRLTAETMMMGRTSP